MKASLTFDCRKVQNLYWPNFSIFYYHSPKNSYNIINQKIKKKGNLHYKL